MPDFPSSPRPSYPIEETPAEPEVLITRHRDGSEQRRLKGAGRKRSWKLPFGNSAPITATERTALINHWNEQHGTADSFSWTHPETSVTYVVRYAETPRFNLVGYNSWEAEVTLQEVP